MAGLKLLQNSPTMLVAAVALASVLPTCAAADANLNCNAYAGAAVAQNEQNIAQQCGFSGGRWLSDVKAHFDWCVLPATKMADLVAEDRARQDSLVECADRAVAAQQACLEYAQTAVGEAAAAVSSSCGFGGGRWAGDYAAHFDWCLSSVIASQAAAEYRAAGDIARFT